MSVAAALVGWLCVVGGAAGTAALRGNLEASQPAARARPPGRTVMIRPCAGAERHLRDNLLSTVDARGIEDVEVVFAVPSPHDPAARVVGEAAEALRARGVRARVEHTTDRGPNNKAAQLDTVVRRMSGLGATPHAWIVVDSDVDLSGVDLVELLHPLDGAEPAAAVWVPPVEDLVASPTAGDRVSHAMLAASLHSFPLLGALDPGTFVGKTFAMRADALTAIGGFDALVHLLGEDLEIARRLRERGERVVRSAQRVRARVGGRTVTAALDRMTRWLMVLKGQRPALLITYPLLFCAPLLVTLAAPLALGLWGFALAVSAIALRATIAAIALRAAKVRAGAIVDLTVASLIADALLLVASARVIASRRITWRGRELLLGARGHLLDAATTAGASAAAHDAVAVTPRQRTTSQ